MIGVLNRRGYTVRPTSEGAPEIMQDISPMAREIIARVRPFTQTSAERVAALCAAVEYVVSNRIPGDFVECGVWKGGSSMAAALAFQRLGDTSRALHLYDTFAGMTAPTDLDRRVDSGVAASELMAAQPRTSNIWAVAPLAEVKANVATVGYPADRVHFVEGKVEDTIPNSAPTAISILRLDTDWYESTRHEMEHLYPRISPAGVLIVDDYGWWQGARKAVDEYFSDVPAPPLLCRMDSSGGRIAVKR